MEKIRQIRLSTGKTQADFAKTYGIRLNTLSAWETGQQNPKKIVVDLLERFAKEDGTENFPKPPNILGVGIKRILEISKLENNEFAQKYGIPQGTVRNWSNGTQKPQRHVLFLLERAVREDTYEPWKTWKSYYLDSEN